MKFEELPDAARIAAIEAYTMTLRDYFAAQAMGSLVNQYYTLVITSDPAHLGHIATAAYRMADVMMKSRENNNA